MSNPQERSECRIITDRILALTIAGAAAAMDLYSMRISNGWILFSLGAGLWFCLSGSGPGLPVYFAGAVLPLALLGWLFRFRMLGSGDIKLFCALGGIMGPEAVLYCIGFSFLTGAAISLALLISCGGFTERISYFLEYLTAYLSTGIRKPYRREGSVPENFHFTIPIFMSVMLYTGGIY